MEPKKSSNRIPNIHRFITSEHGENYWFGGCGRYVMGALGETDYDYAFFAGLTGDVFAQVYPYDHFRGDGVTDFRMSDGECGFAEGIFHTCGYDAAFIPEKQLKTNRETHLQGAMASIDRGVPVISNLVIAGHTQWIVFVGYEEGGGTLLFMTDNMTEPERVSAEDVFGGIGDAGAIHQAWHRGWIFIGDKKEQKPLAQLYRGAILGLPKLLTTKTSRYCFGAEAFRAWAADVESGRFAEIEPETLDGWRMYGSYVCNAATNASCCYAFLDRAMALNPNFAFLKEVRLQYEKMKRLWNEGPDSLEALGGGFSVTRKAMQSDETRVKIAGKLREFAACVDEAVRVLEEHVG